MSHRVLVTVVMHQVLLECGMEDYAMPLQQDGNRPPTYWCPVHGRERFAPVGINHGRGECAGCHDVTVTHSC